MRQQVPDEIRGRPLGLLAPLALDALAIVVELGGLAQQQVTELVALARGHLRVRAVVRRRCRSAVGVWHIVLRAHRGGSLVVGVLHDVSVHAACAAGCQLWLSAIFRPIRRVAFSTAAIVRE